MFKSLKSFIKKLFTAENECEHPASGVPRKSENRKSAKHSKKPDKAAAGQRGSKKTASANSKKNKKTVSVKEIPVMPEILKEVAACEGKVRFLDFELDKRVQAGIQYAGFEYCTPIQEMTLPPLLENRDLAGKAQTGTGKTAAFLLVSFNRLLSSVPGEPRPNASPRMVVMAPTRELAMQIHQDACQLGIYTGLNIAVVFGGMDHEKQRQSLDCQLDILIGTPGRVIDYSRSGALNLRQVEILVIDEADRMLDMGFIPDVKRIVSQMPRKGERQTLLFSATLDESILQLASGWLAEPVVLESEPEQMVSENITQTFYSVLREEKLALLLHILKNMEYERLIIFGNRKDVNLRLQYDLSRYGFDIPLLSGDISQEKRIKILDKFRSGKEKVVIATDVAARGIHVDNVSIVVNYDLPEQPEDYIHRIGRTGRAGHTGLSISFLCEYGAYYLPPIEKLLNTQFSSTLPTEDMLQLPEETGTSKFKQPDSSSRNSRRNGGSSGGPRSGKFRRGHR